MNIHQTRTALVVLVVTGLGHSLSNAGETSEIVTTVAVPEGGKPVVARVDKAGMIHLLYDSDDGPRYAKSIDGGETFGRPISVVGATPQPAGLQYSAWDMAIGKGGRIHVALATNAWKLKLPEEEWGYFYASLDPSASAFSTVRNINKKPSEGFSIAADEKGNVTACWLSDKLYANVSHDNGDTFAPYVEINKSYNPCNCCTTSAAYGEDGRLAVLYREESGNERDMHVVLWDQKNGKTDRKRVGSTPWKIDACPMTYYTVGAVRDGFVAVWPTKGQIYFTRLDRDGVATKQAEIKTPGQSGMRTGVLALPGGEGSTLVAWKKDGLASWQLYNIDGQPLKVSGSVKSSGSGIAGVLGKGGQFILFR